MDLRHSIVIGTGACIAQFSVCLSGCGAGGGSGSPPDAALGPAIVFTDITRAMGLSPTSQCLVVADFNRDGKPDILLAEMDNYGRFAGALGLHRYRDDGTFERMPIPLPQLDFVHRCLTADIDRDGWPDLAIGGALEDKPALAILRNTGGTGFDFSDLTKGAAGAVVTDSGVHIEAIGFFDYDNDGFVDLCAGYSVSESTPTEIQCDVTKSDFQCHFNPPPMAYPPLLLHNDGGQAFSKSHTGLSDPAYVNVFSFMDWDGDGRTDVLQLNDFEPNRLLHNTTSGFVDLLPALKANPDNHGMGAAWSDFDHDGNWDLFIEDAGPDQFYFGRSDGTIAQRAAEVGVFEATRLRLGWSPVTADLNNDGWPDIFIAGAAMVDRGDQLAALFESKRSVSVDAVQADLLLTNEGGRSFSPTHIPTPGWRPTIGEGAVVAVDLNGDGLLDIVETVFGEGAVVKVLRNDTPAAGYHWLGVRLVGRKACPDAIGATIRAHDGAHEIDRRTVAPGGMAGSSNQVHFGLGTRDSIPGLTVAWPGGAVQEVSGPIAADQVLTIEEM